MTKWLALLAISLLPAIAYADQAATAAQFAAIMQNPGHRQLVLNTAKATPAWAHISCASAAFTPAPEIGVYLPIIFDKSGQPIFGEWREGIVATGCGATLTLNVLTQITAPSTLQTGFLLPGGTIADPILQNYAQSIAAKAAGGIPAGCKDAFIANTEFSSYDNAQAAAKPGQNTGPWKEIWTLNLCGAVKRVAMHFVPDANGTTINAEPAT